MSQEIRQSLDTLKLAMQNDPELSWSWHCNITMPIYDSFQFNCDTKINVFESNIAAARVMLHLFDIDMTQNKFYIDCIDSHTKINVPEFKLEISPIADKALDEMENVRENILKSFGVPENLISSGVCVNALTKEDLEKVKEVFNTTSVIYSMGAIISPEEFPRGQNPSFIHIDESPFVGSQDTNKDETN